MYPKCVICTYKKGKVRKAGELNGLLGMSYNTKKKRFCAGIRAAVGCTTAEYKLSKGKIKTVVYYHPGMMGSPGNKATKNGKPISEAEYCKATKKYTSWKQFKIW